MTTAAPQPGIQYPTSPAQMFYPTTSFVKAKKSTPTAGKTSKSLSSPTFRVETTQLPRLLLTALCMQAIFLAGESHPLISPLCAPQKVNSCHPRQLHFLLSTFFGLSSLESTNSVFFFRHLPNAASPFLPFSQVPCPGSTTSCPTLSTVELEKVSSLVP
jgi:hypothetical protein